jgi:hypothetical protein
VGSDGTYYWAGEISSFGSIVESIVVKGGPEGVSDIVYVTGIGGARNRAFGVAYDDAGNAYIAGSWASTFVSSYLWEFSADGRERLNYMLFEQGTATAYGVILDNSKPNPNAYVTGTLNTMNPDEGIDAFVAKVSFH